GVSRLRSAVPVGLFGLLFSGVLFELEEHVLADANRQAARLNAMIRGFPVQDIGVLNRRWIVGQGGDIYHYEFFDQRSNRFSNLSMFHIDDKAWKLSLLTYAKEVELTRSEDADESVSRNRLSLETRLAAGSPVAEDVRAPVPPVTVDNEHSPTWMARSGWVREFKTAKRRGD